MACTPQVGNGLIAPLEEALGDPPYGIICSRQLGEFVPLERARSSEVLKLCQGDQLATCVS